MVVLLPRHSFGVAASVCRVLSGAQRGSEEKGVGSRRMDEGRLGREVEGGENFADDISPRDGGDDLPP